MEDQDKTYRDSRDQKYFEQSTQHKEETTNRQLLCDVGPHEVGASVELAHWSVALLEVDKVVEHFRVHGGADSVAVADLDSVLLLQLHLELGEVEGLHRRPGAAVHLLGSLQHLTATDGARHCNCLHSVIDQRRFIT